MFRYSAKEVIGEKVNCLMPEHYWLLSARIGKITLRKPALNA
ncbi:MAG: hypothetical protein ACM3TN_10465 [Alphaproteobacteria bacterium]